jgi:hypothetical protein
MTRATPGGAAPSSLRSRRDAAAAEAATHAEDPLLVAPAVVVRAALWPANTVAALAAAGAGIREHEVRLLRELEALWRVTLGCPRFCRALAASNPQLYARLRRVSLPQRWNKRVRQLAATLYQYLARACWRTEPNALWAGVQLAQWNVPSQEAAERWCVAPHLGPLRALFQQRVADDSYAADGRYKLHPGLAQHGPGEWRIRTIRRVLRVRFKSADVKGLAAVDRAVRALHGRPPSSRTELIARAAAVLDDTARATAFVEALVRSGVLLGGVRFPVRYETAWQAIQLAATRLHPAHRSAWDRCATRLQTLCDGLEKRAGQLHADEILAAMEGAENAIRALAACWSLPMPELPRTVLHIDSTLPWQFDMDAEVRARVLSALGIAEAFRLHADPVTAHDRAHARAIVAGTPVDEAALTIELARRRVVRQQWARAHPHLPLLDDTAPPFGVLLLRLGERRSLVNGFSHEPWLAYGRFGALVAALPTAASPSRTRPRRHALHRWCEARLRALAKSSNVIPALLIAPAGELPNLWAQPRFAHLRTLDPYGNEADQWPNAGLKVRSDGVREWIEVGDGADAMRMIAVCGSALNVGAHDGLLEQLLLTSWRYRPVLQPRDETEGPPGEALSLGQKTDWQRARWDLGAACTAELLAATPAQRWARWQELAAEHHWPPLLTLGRADGPPMLLPRDSALAVETLVRGLRAEDRLIVEAAGDECFVRDERGNRHATELAVVFARRQHAWQDVQRPVVDANQPRARMAEPAAALARSSAGGLGA